MHTFQAAQPALLYLVPFCIFTSMITAFIRGEFFNLWNYSEESKSEDSKSEQKDQKDQKNQKEHKEQKSKK